MGKGSPVASSIPMTVRHYNLLKEEGNRSHCSRSLYRRIQILLQASKGESNKGVARSLGISVNTVKHWRRCWLDNYVKLEIYERGIDGEGISNHKLLNYLLGLLKDRQRSGAPIQISESQKRQIIALACESPEDYGFERTEWTLQTLAKASIEQKIVISISASYTGRVLKNESITTS